MVNMSGYLFNYFKLFKTMTVQKLYIFLRINMNMFSKIFNISITSLIKRSA